MGLSRQCAGLPGAPCTSITSKRRCPACDRKYEVLRGPRRMQGRYDAAWRKLVAQAIREHPWCSVPGCRDTDLTGDHITPLDRGGRNVRSNVQILCRGHNSSKGARQNIGAGVAFGGTPRE
jgi:5-methylcytosine-specific restriction endonuclease McrA